ncbi:N-acetylmuramoyl-L-alanine amidase [Streptomyces polyrhachis]|uniref:N-acetylmuramoyl-L-alanine amidase n=1 Tax=Streptomyces polyrhachis TaxID=1282885 RepID=A0ABW2GCS4_9ACTN
MFKRKAHAYRPLTLKRRAWLTLGAVVLGGAGAVTIAVASPEDAPRPDPVEARKSGLRSLGLAGTAAKKQLGRTETKQFSLVGLSWDKAGQELDGTIQIRTRSLETGEWTGWQPVSAEADMPDEVTPEMRGGSGTRWVGPSDAAEARVVAADATEHPLPQGLELVLVDPGVTAAEAKAAEPGSDDFDTASFSVQDTTTGTSTTTGGTTTGTSTTTGGTTTGTSTTTGETTTGTSTTTGETTTGTSTTGGEEPPPVQPTPPAPRPSTVAKPPIKPRSTWATAADEALVAERVAADPREYLDKIDVAFVHHTAEGTNYTCAQSSQMVRGVFIFHTQQNEWKDIGYNFVVDKCGQIFEGMSGGMDLPVKGAHTYGYNSYSTGIALLGTYSTQAPTRAAQESIARIAAWKLGMYGVSPTSQVTLAQMAGDPAEPTGVKDTFYRIAGHRDGYATECPGQKLYDRLPKIRAAAASPGISHALKTTDLRSAGGTAAADGIGDLFVGLPKDASAKGAVKIVPGGDDGPVSAARMTLTQDSAGVPGGGEAGDGFGSTTAVGDLNGDGVADLAVGSPGEDLGAYTDAGYVTFLYGPALNTGGAVGGTKTGAKLGSALTTGDFNGDGKADLFSAGTGNSGSWWTRDSASGRTAGGTLTTATGAVSFPAATSGDFNRDGYADVMLSYRDQGLKGRLLSFKGSATGLVKGAVLATPGGRSLAAGDVNGDLIDDLVVGQPYGSESAGNTGGQITTLQGATGGWTSTTVKKVLHQDSTGVAGGSESGDAFGQSVSVNDVNGDGYGDVLVGAPREDLSAKTDAGMAWLLKGASTGLTPTGWTWTQDSSGIAGGAESGDRLGSTAVLADLSGYGRADLAIGVDGEDTGNGTILQLDAGSTGISNTGGAYYGTTALGASPGLRIGSVLAP